LKATRYALSKGDWERRRGEATSEATNKGVGDKHVERYEGGKW